jgi:activator of HSP90 ATPase
MPTAIHKEVDFKASPQRIYEALLDAKQFSAFSGAPAEIDRNPGGAFSCFGGVITGRSVELVPNKRIVQAWRVKMWPEGLYSMSHSSWSPRAPERFSGWLMTGFRKTCARI